MSLQVRRYKKEDENNWNLFVSNAKNATFLLDRNFIEYHSDRFEDFSIMIYNNSDVLKALLPLSIHGNEVISHGGLTYGGFIIQHNLKTVDMLEIFESVIKFIKDNAIVTLTYKAIPHIYHLRPSEEDLYGLFRSGFKLVRRDVSSSINMRTTKIKGQKQNGYRKALKGGLELEETFDCSDILAIVNRNLLEKYDVNPVHKPVEMNLLKNKFKKNILFFNLIINRNIEGGMILFIDNNVVHAQYITTTPIAKRCRGLDFIIVSIIEMFKDDYEWFDFGTSTEQNGSYLNTGLIKSKEEFGLSAICYDTYKLVL
ncbi:GNAT family N-acetyltransferase [Flavobacteriaceae bacterium]|nr:GNAT family N-acetyltransferase [Flavobacteriaceae bacterium]